MRVTSGPPDWGSPATPVPSLPSRLVGWGKLALRLAGCIGRGAWQYASRNATGMGQDMTAFGMGPQVRQGSPSKAVLAGIGVAVAGSLVWGLIAYLTKYQLSVMALAIGAAVGTVVIRVNGRNRHPGLAVASAALSVFGCALGSLVAEILVLLSHGIPASVIMANLNLVLRVYPKAVGGLGFLFWILAALYGYRIAMGAPVWRRGYGRRPAPQAARPYPGFGSTPGQPADGQYPGYGATPGQPPAPGTEPGQPAAPGNPPPQ